MRPNIWGKYLWISIHFIAMEYPHNPTDEDKINYRRFFEQLRYVIPCVTCANNYTDHLVKYPLNDRVLKNRLNLFRWTVDMHNEVNKITHADTISYDDATKIFTDSLVHKNDEITRLLKSHDHLSQNTPSNNAKSHMILGISLMMFFFSCIIMFFFLRRMKK